jgi:hypothetical protein
MGNLHRLLSWADVAPEFSGAASINNNVLGEWPHHPQLRRYVNQPEKIFF